MAVFESAWTRWTEVKMFNYFYLSHTQLYREYITSSEMYSLHLTHPKWTHTRSSGQPCYSARGAVGGSVPCSRTPQSWYWRRILPPPTIPAGSEIRTHNLPLTSPTRYPLGHDCPRFFDIVNVLCSLFVHWKCYRLISNLQCFFIKFTLNRKSVVLKVFYGMAPISGA